MRADKRRLARVLANLLDNAAKYGDGATVREPAARSTATSSSPSRTAVPACPRRSGPRSSTASTAAASPGGAAPARASASGLALVAEHVRLHGGRVWVEDRTDEQPGARFVVELPTEEDQT